MENSPKKGMALWKKITIGLIVLFVIGKIAGGGVEKQAADNLHDIHLQVALDAEKQYEITKNSGTAIDAYVHAGLVAASYLQAKDEVSYKKWKAIEKEEGARAGMPQ